MKEKERLLNMKSVSALLGIKRQTLYQWHWLRKNLPFIRVGGSLRISEKDLRNFIKKWRKYPDKE